MAESRKAHLFDGAVYFQKALGLVPVGGWRQLDAALVIFTQRRVLLQELVQMGVYFVADRASSILQLI